MWELLNDLWPGSTDGYQVTKEFTMGPSVDPGPDYI